ncbi:MAG: hypothetical protein IT350_00430 [Deltaproteobacteria bacterium]|nr:hypothetical protein [Deltaproteobacteria bacterium]
MRRTAILIAVILSGIAAASCTFEDGKGFATLNASMIASWTVPADRDAGNGWQRLNNSYEIRLVDATFTFDHIALEALASSDSGDSTTFDPANPPAGYSLCHGGHCHSAEGELVSYEDIQAEMDGGGGSSAYSAVVALPVGEFDLESPASRDLECDAGCELPAASISRLRISPTRLRLAGDVRGGAGGEALAEPVRWFIDVELAPDDAIVHAVDLVVDRDKRPNIDLAIAIVLGPDLLDDLDWAAYAVTDGAIDLGAQPSEHEGETLADHLGEKIVELEPDIDIERTAD